MMVASLMAAVEHQRVVGRHAPVKVSRSDLLETAPAKVRIAPVVLRAAPATRTLLRFSTALRFACA
jgi:hypothetical protein